MKNNISGVDCQPVAMGVIYLITCRINGKPYVGQTRQKLERRINHHKSDSKKVKSGVDAAIAKYGWENFSVAVLEVCPVEMLDAREKFWIAALNSKVPNGYNLTDGGGGQGGCAQETREKISAALKGRPTWNKGVSPSAETRKKLSDARKHTSPPNQGKHHTAEAKAKISAGNKGKHSHLKGRHLSEQHKAKLSAAGKGRKHSAESRAKMSAALKAYWAREKLSATRKSKKHSPETIAKIRESNKRTWAKLSAALKGKSRKPHSPETRAKIASAVKAAWARKKAVENGGK